MAPSPKARDSKLSPDVRVRTWNDHIRDDDELETTGAGETTALEEKSPRDTQATRTLRSLWKNGWLLELLSAGASVLAFVAIIAALGHYDGCTIPTLPLGATVSLLAFFLRPWLTIASVAERRSFHPCHHIKSYDDDVDCGGVWTIQMAQVCRKASQKAPRPASVRRRKPGPSGISGAATQYSPKVACCIGSHYNDCFAWLRPISPIPDPHRRPDYLFG